jgi:hypothetical protein
VEEIVSWLKRCIWSILLFSGVYMVLFLIDQSSWNPAGWSDKVFQRIQSIVPESWFVDQFAFFSSYEFNFLITVLGIGAVVGIIWDFYSYVLLDKEGGTEQ